MKFARTKVDELALNVTDGEHGSVVNDPEGNYYLLSNKNIRNGTVIYDESDRKISENSFQKINRRTKLENNDVIIATVGSIGRTAIIREETLKFDFQRSVGIIKPNPNKLLPDYLHFYFQLPYVQKRLNNLSKGAVQKCLFISDLRDIDIDVPEEFSYQEKLSKVLSDLDAKIELNNKMNIELEAMAKLIYDYWFVQFDFPDENGRPYKSSGGKMVYNEDLKREIPEGWEVKRLDEIVDKIIDYRGKTPKKLGGDWSENKNDIIALSAKHVKGGKLVNLSDANRVSKELFEVWMKDQLQNGDILMTSEAPCGEFFYLVGESNYCLSQRLFAIRSNSGIVEHSYLYFELSSGHGYSQIQGKMSGSTVFGIRQDELRTVKVLIPEMSLQKKFAIKANSLYLQIRNNEYQNQKLAELRDWLLPMLMNGQVTVCEKKKSTVISISKADNLSDKEAKVRRKMLATYIINQSLQDQTFGKTKFEKLLHLVEYHLLKHNYKQNYTVQAAGPYDGKFTVPFWNEVTKAKWFAFEQKGSLKRIVAGVNHQKSLKDYGYLTAEEKKAINSFVKNFSKTNYEQPEIISTLYAVWNNRIIQNQMITDELLKKDFLEWDEEKAKYTNRLDAALNWMRKEGVVPDGWGEVVERKVSRKSK